jgi:hypothetical protein
MEGSTLEPCQPDPFLRTHSKGRQLQVVKLRSAAANLSIFVRLLSQQTVTLLTLVSARVVEFKLKIETLKQRNVSPHGSPGAHGKGRRLQAVTSGQQLSC